MIDDAVTVPTTTTRSKVTNRFLLLLFVLIIAVSTSLLTNLKDFATRSEVVLNTSSKELQHQPQQQQYKQQQYNHSEGEAPTNPPQNPPSTLPPTLSPTNPPHTAPPAPSPPPPKDHSCLVYFHVPKCGGSSMANLLSFTANKKKWAFQQWYLSNPGAMPTANSTKTNHVIHVGHITPQFLSRSGTENCLRMTVLREPVSRVVSLFYYHKSTNLIPKTKTFQEVFSPSNSKTKTMACKYCPEYTNEMNHMFSAGANESWTSQNTTMWGGDRPAAAEANSLQTSKDFMLTMDLVCFTDGLTHCQEKLGRLLNVTLNVPFPTKNILNSGKNNVLPGTDLESIQRANKKDTDLYAWAVDSFSDQR